MRRAEKKGDTSFKPILGIGGLIYGFVILNLLISLAGVEGAWAVILAIGIASLQALLIAIFSMELFLSRRSVIVIAIVSPLFVILLLGLTVADVYTRSPPLLDPPPVDRSLPEPPP